MRLYYKYIIILSLISHFTTPAQAQAQTQATTALNNQAIIQKSTQANIDYTCLTACVESGRPSAACMPLCSYQLPVKQSKEILPHAKKDAHDQFSPLMVSDGRILNPRISPSTLPLKENYPCITQCLQKGSQYGFCDQQCAKKN